MFGIKSKILYNFFFNLFYSPDPYHYKFLYVPILTVDVTCYITSYTTLYEENFEGVLIKDFSKIV